MNTIRCRLHQTPTILLFQGYPTIASNLVARTGFLIIKFVKLPVGTFHQRNYCQDAGDLEDCKYYGFYIDHGETSDSTNTKRNKYNAGEECKDEIEGTKLNTNWK